MDRGYLATEVLRGVSRSFYLSLRWLPRPMRGPVALAYLLARASDTLADTEGVPVATRGALLGEFRRLVSAGGDTMSFAGLVAREFLPRQENVAERELLERAGECLAWLAELDARVAVPVREVVAVITGGQMLDLKRFDGATAGKPCCLADDGELEDYAWRVAGCVGVFWTRVGVMAFGERFCIRPVAEMERLGAAFGKGLQLVNILRDLPADLRAGRCYLPVADPFDQPAMAAAWRHWCARAREWLQDGLEYATAVRGWRVRAATALPARLGVDTLDLLERGPVPPRDHVKLTRKRVWLAALGSLAMRCREPGGGA